MARSLTDSERERLTRYRHLEALAARAASLSKTSETRDAYNAIAKAWMNLAADVESAAAHAPDEDSAHEFMPVPDGSDAHQSVRRRAQK